MSACEKEVIKIGKQLEKVIKSDVVSTYFGISMLCLHFEAWPISAFIYPLTSPAITWFIDAMDIYTGYY